MAFMIKSPSAGRAYSLAKCPQTTMTIKNALAISHLCTLFPCFAPERSGIFHPPPGFSTLSSPRVLPLFADHSHNKPGTRTQALSSEASGIPGYTAKQSIDLSVIRRIPRRTAGTAPRHNILLENILAFGIPHTGPLSGLTGTLRSFPGGNLKGISRCQLIVDQPIINLLI